MDSQYAYQYAGLNRTQLSELSSGIPQMYWSSTATLYPTGHYYQYNTPFYDTRTAGLYKFTQPLNPPESPNNSNTTNMVVAGNAIDACAGYCQLIAYGTGGDLQSGETWPQFYTRVFNQLKTGQIALTCTNQSMYMLNNVLTPNGYSGRMVRFLTLQPFNGYADGHVTLEVKDPSGNWCCLDLSSHCAVQDSSGNYLKAIDIPATLVAGTETRKWLAPLAFNYEGPVASGAFDATHFCRSQFSNQADCATWQARTFQAVGIVNPADGTTWWMSDGLTTAQQNTILALDPGLPTTQTYFMKTRAQIITQFYS